MIGVHAAFYNDGGGVMIQCGSGHDIHPRAVIAVAGMGRDDRTIGGSLAAHHDARTADAVGQRLFGHSLPNRRCQEKSYQNVMFHMIGV